MLAEPNSMRIAGRKGALVYVILASLGVFRPLWGHFVRSCDRNCYVDGHWPPPSGASGASGAPRPVGTHQMHRLHRFGWAQAGGSRVLLEMPHDSAWIPLGRA